MTAAEHPRTRLAEVTGILAMATDLGLGLPMEHAIRACLLSLELGRRIGLLRAELVVVYDLTLLRMLGCTAGSGDSLNTSSTRSRSAGTRSTSTTAIPRGSGAG